MSKGSARRKGTGFDEGYDRIWGKKDAPEGQDLSPFMQRVKGARELQLEQQRIPPQIMQSMGLPEGQEPPSARDYINVIAEANSKWLSSKPDAPVLKNNIPLEWDHISRSDEPLDRWHKNCPGRILYIDGGDTCDTCGQRYVKPDAREHVRDLAEEPDWQEANRTRPDGPCHVSIKYRSGRIDSGSFRMVNRKDGLQLCLCDASGWLTMWSFLSDDPVTHWAHAVSGELEAKA